MAILPLIPVYLFHETMQEFLLKKHAKLQINKLKIGQAHAIMHSPVILAAVFHDGDTGILA
jgi:hypothetical protein